jgi:hypothetical protein
LHREQCARIAKANGRRRRRQLNVSAPADVEFQAIRPKPQSPRAFSSEADTASREESAQKKKLKPYSDSIRTDQGSKKSLFGGLFTIGVTLGSAGQNLLGNQSGVLPDRRLDFRGHFGIGLEKGFRVLAALPEPLTVI